MSEQNIVKIVAIVCTSVVLVVILCVLNDFGFQFLNHIAKCGG